MRTSRIKYMLLWALIWAPTLVHGQEDGSSEENAEVVPQENAPDEDALLENIERAFHEPRPTPGWVAPSEDVQKGLRLEHRGMFRFRPDIIENGARRGSRGAAPHHMVRGTVP